MILNGSSVHCGMIFDRESISGLRFGRNWTQKINVGVLFSIIQCTLASILSYHGRRNSLTIMALVSWFSRQNINHHCWFSLILRFIESCSDYHVGLDLSSWKYCPSVLHIIDGSEWAGAAVYINYWSLHLWGAATIMVEPPILSNPIYILRRTLVGTIMEEISNLPQESTIPSIYQHDCHCSSNASAIENGQQHKNHCPFRFFLQTVTPYVACRRRPPPQCLLSHWIYCNICPALWKPLTHIEVVIPSSSVSSCHRMPSWAYLCYPCLCQ